ncbi:M20 family metallopeptidase [Nocardiopsis suaedae]|uniref:M20 family metallopeptidase n=1 Tax=Nocardiopsis suaedae TaxID=3018444 RepID=A0ABT4TRJ1_9ACTN|nr:M20 family metallopeptidase [Nocardiopsis suaedae]MDA2806884.1 M20 family metallopeptidase [Nocardiopsis suaedae]
MDRTTATAAARDYLDSGAFFAELSELVAYPTESRRPEGSVALKAYLRDALGPILEELGCTVTLAANPADAGGPFLIATRVEDEERPTVVCYGHADVVDGQAGQWGDGRDPWTLTAVGDRWYGRGTADNKGQHLINLAALRAVLAVRGRLGFNLTMLFETGEEIGSPGLDAFVRAHRDELRADVLIASDGPRLTASTPTLFLGARGGATIELDADLRPADHHSGNWGGLLRNAATTLTGAIGTLVDGHGGITCPALLPERLPDPVRTALSRVHLTTSPDGGAIDTDWADPALTPAERLYGWNTVEVIALDAGDVDAPVNAIPGRARAVLQLRFVVGTDLDGMARSLRAHLDAQGYPMVGVRIPQAFPASRTDLDHPWVHWAAASLERSVGGPVTVLPNIGGSLPNHVFTDLLQVPTIWMPHSYPGCRQHAPDEHLLVTVARQGLEMAAGLFHDLGAAGEGEAPPPPVSTATTPRSVGSPSTRVPR